MYKLTLIALCLIIAQIALAQNEKITIEGTIIISDNNDPNPAPGTIRWTGQDFEGFDGTRWKSLTCGCDENCPDDRYVTHTATATSESIQFEVENSQNLPMRLCYYPSSDPSVIQYWQCEPSTNYGAFGNEHLQTITGLNPGTEYTIIIQSSDDSSNSYGDCHLLVWEDISCPFTVTTLENTCPDARYITHNVTAITHESTQLEVEMSQNLPMRLAYYPSSDPSAIEYRVCEFSANYGAAGNEHLQTITGLNSSTAYTIIIQTSQDVGISTADCSTMNWEDISCPFTVTTAATPNANNLTLSDFNYNVKAAENAFEGNFTSPASPGDTEQIKVTIQPQSANTTSPGYFGFSGKHLLDPSVKEAWVSWYMKLGPNWTPTDGVKLPGFTSHENGGTGGIAGGNGGGWAGLCKSWSARTLIATPTAGSNADLLRIYLYHLDNTNYGYNGGSINDHPCIVNPGNPQTDPAERRYGNMVGGSDVNAQVLGDGNWHCVTQYIKLNTLNTNAPNAPNAAFRDGETRLYIDGVLTGQKTGIHFTNNPDYHNIAFWLQVYHGGSADTSGTTHDVFFDCISVSEGSTNDLQCACQN